MLILDMDAKSLLCNKNIIVVPDFKYSPKSTMFGLNNLVSILL